MKEEGLIKRIPAFALAGLFALIALGPMTGCKDNPTKAVAATHGPRKALTIITPHNEKIRTAFTVNFSNWHEAKNGTPVDIQWIVRGTQECLSYVNAVSTLPPEAAPRVVPDVMFGGGIADHQSLARRGQVQELHLGGRLDNIPPEVAGLPTRDAHGRWFAVALSSFGILYNERLCKERGIAPPASWEDLADPRFYSWVGIADPAASGSNLKCLMLILQKEGLQEGWSTIIRILANSRALVHRSSYALDQVKSGVSLAAFAVNFDGLAIAEGSGGDVRYVNPPKATALSPSLVSVLKTARDPALAEDFVEYALSEEGQVLFGVRSDGRSSYGDTLYHYPIDPEIYDKYAQELALRENPLKTDFGLQIDPEKAGLEVAVLKPLVKAACGSNHVLLQRAWQTVIDAGMPAEPLAELTSLPFDEETAYRFAERFSQAGPAEAHQMIEEWSSLFRAKYEKVIAQAKG